MKYPYSLNDKVATVLAQICSLKEELPQSAPTSPIISQKYDLALQFSLKISLVNSYDSLQGNADGGRIFSAILDIHISFLLLYADLYSTCAVWNKSFSPGKLEGGSVLDSSGKFFGKMDIHRFNIAYVLRYRAFWDKLLGLVILLYALANYDSFVKAKSRKKKFMEIAKQNKFLEEQIANRISELIQNFDNSFRTSEAHGTGVLRKHSFNMERLSDNKKIELIEYWNTLSSFLALFTSCWRDRLKQ